MKKYLAPLGIFVGGQLVLLILFLFLGSIGEAAETLATRTAAYDGIFWNWTWVVASTNFLVFLFAEMFVIGSALVALVKTR